ncbi:MAG: hypothetical protein GC178_10255 [Flavobacteriales bacterium]|nr:hypothetical protein [Flavobacteriales bacterium]
MSEDGALEYHLVQPEDTTVSKIKTPNHTDSETANCCKNLEELKQLAQITDGTIVNYKDSINSLWDSIQRMPIPQSVCFEEKVFHDTDKFVFVNEIFFDPVSSIAMVIHDLTDREATGQICTAEGPIPFENIHETDNDWKITVCDKLYRVSIGSFSSNVNGTGQYHVRITKIPK